MLGDDTVRTLRLTLYLKQIVLIEVILGHCSSSSLSAGHVSFWRSAWGCWYVWNWWLSTGGLEIAHVGVQSCFGRIRQVNRQVSAMQVILLIDNSSLFFIDIQSLRTMAQGLAVLVNCLEHCLIHHCISWHDYRWFLITTHRRLLRLWRRRSDIDAFLAVFAVFCYFVSNRSWNSFFAFDSPYVGRVNSHFVLHGWWVVWQDVIVVGSIS